MKVLERRDLQSLIVGDIVGGDAQQRLDGRDGRVWGLNAEPMRGEARRSIGASREIAENEDT